MWVAVLMVLFVTGSIFYGLARYYINLLDYKAESVNVRKAKISYGRYYVKESYLYLTYIVVIFYASR